METLDPEGTYRMNSQCPEPGIYYDVADSVYRQWSAYSQSEIKHFRDPDLCELEIKHKLEHPPEASDEMRLGQLVEAAVDGLDIDGGVKQLPPEIKARRGAAWQEFQKANPGVEFLPAGEFAKHRESIVIAQAMAANIHTNPYAEKLIKGAKRQVSFIADYTFTGPEGTPVTYRGKGRLD